MLEAREPYQAAIPRGRTTSLVFAMFMVATIGLSAGAQATFGQPQPAKPAADRNLEIDAAIARLRGLGAFVREFHPRGHAQYWVQIISTGSGEKSRQTAEDFGDEALVDVEVVARGVPLDLHLRETSVTSAGLARLASVGKFSILDLSGKNVDDALLRILPKLPLQGQLAIQSDRLTDDGLRPVAECRELQSVSLAGKLLSDDCLQLLVGLPRLAGVSLGQNFTPAALATLGRIEGLRDLNVPWQEALQFSDYRRFPNLRRLSLSGKEHDDRTALIIPATFKSLEQAYLRNTSITNVGVQRLSRSETLTVLTLDGAPIDDGAADSIRRMKQLKWLSLNECTVGDATLAAIAECSQLWFLSLNGTQVTDAGLEALVELKNLKVVYLSSCAGVTDDGIKHLTQLPAPQRNSLHINIQATGITEQGARRLQETVPNGEITWGVPAVPLRAK